MIPENSICLWSVQFQYSVCEGLNDPREGVVWELGTLQLHHILQDCTKHRGIEWCIL